MCWIVTAWAWATDHATVLAAVVAALAGVAVAAFTLTLKWSTDRLWSAGERQHAISNRAFVFIDGFNTEITTLSDSPDVDTPEALTGIDRGLYVTRFAVQPRWKNSGNTPTKNMTIQVDWNSPGGTLPLDFPYEYRNPREPYFLGPRAEDRSEFIEMPGANALINDGNDVLGLRPLMFIWGHADYEDVFGTSHFVQWCYRVRFERHRGERLRADFIQWGHYNRSDEDSRTYPV